MQTLHIKPAAGLLVRDPISAVPLHAEGEHKPLDAYWSRRLLEGSVHEVVTPQAHASKPEKKSKTED